MNAIEVIQAAEAALAEGQHAVAGNDATEGERANSETVYFDALKACRNYLAMHGAKPAVAPTESKLNEAGIVALDNALDSVCDAMECVGIGKLDNNDVARAASAIASCVGFGVTFTRDDDENIQWSAV